MLRTEMPTLQVPICQKRVAYSSPGSEIRSLWSWMSNVAALMGCSPDKGQINCKVNRKSSPQPPVTGEIRMAFLYNNKAPASAGNDGEAGLAGNEGAIAQAAVPDIEGPLSATLMGGLLLDNIFWMMVRNGCGFWRGAV